MNESIVIQGDTGKIIITGMNVSKMVDLSKYKPGQVYVSPYLANITEGTFTPNNCIIEVSFNE